MPHMTFTQQLQDMSISADELGGPFEAGFSSMGSPLPPPPRSSSLLFPASSFCVQETLQQIVRQLAAVETRLNALDAGQERILRALETDTPVEDRSAAEQEKLSLLAAGAITAAKELVDSLHYTVINGKKPKAKCGRSSSAR